MSVVHGGHDNADISEVDPSIFNIPSDDLMNGFGVGLVPAIIVNPEVQAPPVHGECAVCVLERAIVVLLPCRHVCLCSVCARMINSSITRCLMCNRAITTHLEVYVT